MIARNQVVAGVILLLFGLVDSTYAGGYTMSVSDESGVAGETATVSVSLDSAGEAEVDGFSLALCDDSLVELPDEGSIVWGNALAAVNDGDGPDFEGIQVTADAWSVGTVIALTGGDALAPSANNELYEATYDLLGEGLSIIEFCTVGDPPVGPNIVTINGESTPTTVDGSIEILDLPPIYTLLRAEDAELILNLAGDTLDEADVLVTLTNEDPSLDVGAFSFGIRHDGQKLDLIDINLDGTVTEDVNGGAGPEYVFVNLDPAGGSGGTIAVVISLEEEPFDTIAPGSEQPLVHFVYDSGPGATAGDSVEVEFTDQLGSPPVGLVVSVEGVTWPPIVEDATVTISETDVIVRSFLRCDLTNDGNINITDATSLLNFLFSGTFQPDCEATADTNDDGNLQITDATILLNYLFQAGAPPGGNFPDCDNAPIEECEESTVSCD